MSNIINKMFLFTRSKLGYAYYNMQYIRKTSKKLTAKDGTYAIVNVDDFFRHDDFGRYFYLICMYFKHAGFNLSVKINWYDLKRKSRFNKLLLKQNYSFVRNCSAPLNTVVLVQPNKANRIIHLSYGYNILQSGKFDCIVPYPMFPTQYKFYLSSAILEEVKRSDRTIKVFFAGSTGEEMYKNKKTEVYFNVIPRLKVLEIMSGFEKSRTLQTDSDKIFLTQLLSSKDYINEVIISQVKTEEEEWLKILTRVDFFVCPPGVRMPWCHNCVEAMAAGAIPILQYADLFYPPLLNLENCLTYTNSLELRLAIEKALEMKPFEIEKIRKNVLNYYNDYLSIDSIAKRIKKFSNNTNEELKVAIPFIPTYKQLESIFAFDRKNPVL